MEKENEPPDKEKDNSSYYKCIKTSLKSIVKHDFVIDKLIQASNMSNKVIIHTLQLMKLYFIYLYDNGEKIPTINRQFITSIMKTVCIPPTQGRAPSETTKGIKDNLKDFYDIHYKNIQGETLNYKYMNTVLDYLAIDILTMYENNIKQHFIEYIERFVNVVWRKKVMVKLIKKKFKTPKSKQQAINKLCNQLRRIKNDLLNTDTTKSKTSSSIYHSWIDKERKNILPNRKYKKDNIYYDLLCSPQEYLPFMFYMMKKVESYGESANNICPLRSDIIPKYFRLDTTSLIHLLFTKKQGNKSFYLTNGNLVKYQEKIWNFFFKTNLKFFHSDESDNYKYKFNCMIETDGVGVSILLIRKDLEGKRLKSPKVTLNNEKYINELTEDEYTILQEKKVVAIDPNMSDLIYCINEDGQKFRYTQDQRRKETKQKKYRNILQEDKLETKINDKNIVEWETVLSHYNKKTLDFDKFKDYIKQKNIMNIALQEFYEKNLYRKLKLSSFINRKKSESKLINNFCKLYGNSEETIIGFGDFEQYQHRKFKEPVKGKGFRTLFRKAGYKVYLVDEFRTSCRCSHCESDEGVCKTFRECENPRPWMNNRIVRHGLVKCKTCSGLWNRDTNASRNILKITLDEINRLGRPEYLKRSQMLNQ
jgi:transposase